MQERRKKICCRGIWLEN